FVGREAPARRPQPESGEAVGGSPWRRWREWASSLEFTLARRFGLATREERLFFLLIGVVGVFGGRLGMATEGLIQAVQAVLLGSPGGLLVVARKVPRWVVIAAPSCGRVLV